MSYGSNMIYRYDGSFAGFLCCFAQCFKDKKLPQGVQLTDEPQATIFPVRVIATDEELASRAQGYILERAGRMLYDMARDAFLTCMEEKELRLIRFLLLGCRHGEKAARLAANDDVHAVDKALLYLKNEVHFHVELLRFTDCGEFLVGVITPNNLVLPYIVPHFCDRFSGENFVIFDKNHGMGFMHRAGKEGEFFRADSLTVPEPNEEEAKFRALWQIFYDTIAVEGRINPKLRMTHMPKRYWGNLVEKVG